MDTALFGVFVLGKCAMQDRDFWDAIIEQIEQFRRANRFGTVQLKIRNHEIVHFEMTPVMRGELPKRPFPRCEEAGKRESEKVGE